MGIPTLISTATASGASSVNITSGIDSTYDEYMFVLTDINVGTDSAEFQFNGSIDGGSNYNVTKTTTSFYAYNIEDDSSTSLGYWAAGDLAQSTSDQMLWENMGSGADESGAAILHLFTPASTTYVKHFYFRSQQNNATEYCIDLFVAGYFNDTNDIDAITFKTSTGTFDGVIQMYGIA